MKSRSAALIILAFLTAPRAAHGQLQDAGPFIWRADLTGVTQYSWRGIRMNDHFALQPDVAIGFARAGFSVTGGARASGDTELAGFFHEYFQEVEAWGQVALRRGGMTSTFGVMAFWHGAPPLPSGHNTELYGSFRYQMGRWAPALQVWTGVQGVHGTYLEPSITRYHIANPFAGPGASLSSRLTAGFQLGKRAPESPLIPGPTGTGLIFVELATVLRVALDLGPVTLVTSLGPSLRVNHDPAAKLQPDGTSDKVNLSFPVQVGVALPGRRRQ